MIKHQACSLLPVQVDQPAHLQQHHQAPPSNILAHNNAQSPMLAHQEPQQQTSSPMLITPSLTQRRQQQQSQFQSHHLVNRLTSKLASRRHHLQNQTNHHHQYHLNHHHQQRPKVIRASEYKNLRQVVPSLRRQRDVGKVEVVTEAARYIDHLHKTLIERFILCGIPDSLKDVLGTDDANELNSQHIMNLITKMAAKQQQQQHHLARRQQHSQTAGSPAAVAAAMRPTGGSQRAPINNNSARAAMLAQRQQQEADASQQLLDLPTVGTHRCQPLKSTKTTTRSIAPVASRGGNDDGTDYCKKLPPNVDAVGGANQSATLEDKSND